MNLVEPLYHWASIQANRTAIAEGFGTTEKSISYGELLQAVNSVREQLQSAGIGSTSKVLLMLPIGIDLYVTLLALFSNGSTAVIVDPSVSKETMNHAMLLAQPDSFIGSSKAHLLRLKFKCIRSIRSCFHTTGWTPMSTFLKVRKTSSVEKPARSVAPDHPALITFTSGSTGMVKAACRSHAFLMAQHKALSKSIDHQLGEVDLITLPVFGLANLASGMSSVIAATDLKFPAKANSENILRQCQIHKLTRCAASPAFFEKLFNDGKFPDFTSIYTGGAPVFPDFLEKLERSYKDLKISTVYGSTEAEPISHQCFNSTPTEAREAMKTGKGLMVGKAVDEIDLLIVKENSTEPVASTMVGEILVSGEHVLKAYLNSEADRTTKIAIKEKIWHRTGDAGYLDKEGNLWLVGRCKAILRHKCRSFYPFCIESIARSIDGVLASALCIHEDKLTLCYHGKKDPKQILAAVIEHGVEQALRLDAIPMDARHNAKVNYPALHKMLERV